MYRRTINSRLVALLNRAKEKRRRRDAAIASVGVQISYRSDNDNGRVIVLRRTPRI